MLGICCNCNGVIIDNKYLVSNHKEWMNHFYIVHDIRITYNSKIISCCEKCFLSFTSFLKHLKQIHKINVDVDEYI